MGIAINVRGTAALPSVPQRNARPAVPKAPRPRRSRLEQLRYESGLIRHLMLGTAMLVAGGYGLAAAIAML
jgi:hypothetical protein